MHTLPFFLLSHVTSPPSSPPTPGSETGEEQSIVLWETGPLGRYEKRETMYLHPPPLLPECPNRFNRRKRKKIMSLPSLKIKVPNRCGVVGGIWLIRHNLLTNELQVSNLCDSWTWLASFPGLPTSSLCAANNGVQNPRVFSLNFCVLQVIKNWRWGRPGHQAKPN